MCLSCFWRQKSEFIVNDRRRSCKQEEHSIIRVNYILGDPGADKGDEGKSKRAEKYIWNEEK